MVAAVSPTQAFNLGLGPITCHAWNHDKSPICCDLYSELAVSPNNSDIHIMQRGMGNKWECQQVLTNHELPVTGIDWGHRTNRIVTCSQDKNAFVWTFDNESNKWKPEIVLVRLTRAATCVKWSPLENKFAVGSGSRQVSVCYYEVRNTWWVTKHIKQKIRSTVNSLSWHPNNILLAVGSCDFKTRVFSAYIKEVDEKPGPTPWGSKMPMGNLMAEYSSKGGGWVHSVQFSPSGNRLAWVGHDSSISVVDASMNKDELAVAYYNYTFFVRIFEFVSAGKDPAENGGSNSSSSTLPKPGSMTSIKEWYLPFTSLQWVTENSFVAAGHDCCPMLFTYDGPGRLRFVSKLDVPSEQKSNKITAMSKFRNLDKSAAESLDQKVNTLHQNTITEILPLASSPSGVSKFSTTAIDGQLILWDLQALQAKVASISVA